MDNILDNIKSIIECVGLVGGENVTMPLNVYCSLVKCALQNSTLGLTTSLLRRDVTLNSNTSFNTEIKNTIDSLLRISNAETENLTKMPMPPEVKKGHLEGELKDSLDKVKSELLQHYSLYYNLEEYDIPTRINLLSQHTTEDTENDYKKYLKKEYKLSDGVMEMVENLKNNFENINERIKLLENQLEIEISDPNTREFQYNNSYVFYRTLFSYLRVEWDELENMKEHVRNLYGNLHNQAKINQKKIDVLQKKLQTLKAHTRLVNQRDPNDKRNAN
uniref:Uncharacterized protein n=1 Tax=Theileria annulata TaxID=5874 RepID=A0A3B0N8B7_THEAN